MRRPCRAARDEAAARVTADEQRGKADRQLKRSEALLYAGQLALVQTAWREDNVPLAWHHLESTRWDYRGWEYRHIYSLLNRNQRTFLGHASPVLSLAFSPDGKRVASAGGDPLNPSYRGEVKVWDVHQGHEILTLEG